MQLAEFIRTIRLLGTHEHLWKEDKWRATKPHILGELFENRVPANLRVADQPGAGLEGRRLRDRFAATTQTRFPNWSAS